MASAVACKTAADQAPVASPEDAAPAEPTTEERGPPPPDAMGGTYVSTSDEQEADDEDDEAREAADDNRLKIAEVHTLVEEAASEKLGGVKTLRSPALVPSWPHEGATVVFLVYPLKAKESNVSLSTVGAPVEVTVDLAAKSTQVRELKKSKSLKTHEEKRVSSTLRETVERAEQALIDVLLEARPLDRSLGLLQGYDEWFQAYPKVTADLESRVGGGIKWLKRPTSS